MQLTFAASGTVASGAWIVGALEGSALTATAARADKASGGAISRGLAVSRFTGKRGQLLEVLAPAGVAASRIVLVGLGKASEFDSHTAEEIAASAIGALSKSGEGVATFDIDPPKGAKLKPGALAAHLAMGARLKSYTFNHYRTKDLADHEFRLKKVTIATPDAAAAKKSWASLEAVADGMCLARDLVNEPPNVLSPAEFANRCKALSKLGVKVEVLGEAEMKKLGMGALLGVGQGSERESQLVVMHWNGGRKKDAPVAFVGKGVCFDSGGLSLKTGAGMMGMKGDMGGAAAVTGAIRALAARKARVNAVGVIGLVENMPDGSAQRPDDVVKSMSGQTIEVLNTDAEGRLVLADALTYAQTKFKPKFVVDLATLTGAIMVALGAEHAGLFSNDDKLANRIAEAGKAAGEPVWRLPLGRGYDKMIKSKIADMKNITGTTNAGSIAAAQFLQRFVEKGQPWAHLDIAGMAWQDGEQRTHIPSWGTGYGVRLLERLVAEHYEG
jgi:leucyl aminopeptidase